MDDRTIPLSVLREYMPKLKDEDLKELGPVEYDQSKVPEVSKKHAENVRRKVYLQDMTESFARGVEYAGLIANEAEIKAKNADLLSKDTQNRFKDQIEGTTNSAEVIDARRPFGKESYQTLSERLEATDEEIRQSSINPDNFDGNDSEKLQQAIDLAIGSQETTTIRLYRMFDVTGTDSLKINLDHKIRKPLYFVGEGGGIRKDDSGYIFDSDEWKTGDIHTTGCRFESVSGSGACVLNGNKIFRYFDNSSTFLDIDKIIESETYIQSIYLNQPSIVGGTGYALTFNAAYDIHLVQALVEHRDGLIHQTNLGGSDTTVFGLTITDSLVEGMTDIPFVFEGIVSSLKVDGLYLEKNKSQDFKFGPTSYINVATFNNVMTSNEGSSLVRTSFLKLEGKHEILKLSNVFGIGDTHYILDTSDMPSGWNFINAENVKAPKKDNLIFPESNKSKIILNSSLPNSNVLASTNNYKFRDIPLGHFRKISGVINVYADVRNYFTREYNIGYKIKPDDIISVQATQYRNNNRYFIIAQTYANASGDLAILFKNDGETSLINCDIQVTILTSVINYGTGGVEW